MQTCMQILYFHWFTIMWYISLPSSRERQLVPSEFDGTWYEIICALDNVWKHVVIAWQWFFRGFSIFCQPVKYMSFMYYSMLCKFAWTSCIFIGYRRCGWHLLSCHPLGRWNTTFLYTNKNKEYPCKDTKKFKIAETQGCRRSGICSIILFIITH